MKNQRRLIKEKTENQTPGEFFYIQPIDGNMFEWHFTLRGMTGSIYEGGLFHGCFKIPNDYPLKPPDMYMFNNSGRYETNKKICLTFTSFHQEEWTPAWTLRSMMEALCAYFVIDDNGIGSIKSTDSERKLIAINSRKYTCPQCGNLINIEDKILNYHSNK